MFNKNKTLVKQYRGSEIKAQRMFILDSIKKEKQGYVSVSEKFMPGSYGLGNFLLALLLCFVLVGILAFIYMLVVKPAGILTVTYELQESESTTTPANETSVACPKCAETIKHIELVSTSSQYIKNFGILKRNYNEQR